MILESGGQAKSTCQSGCKVTPSPIKGILAFRFGKEIPSFMHPLHAIWFFLHYWLLGLLLLAVPATSITGPAKDSPLERIQQKGYLSVQTRLSPTVYYQGQRGPTGFEYELIRGLADRLGVSLNLKSHPGPVAALDAVRRDGDIGVAGITLSARQDGVYYTRPILDLQPFLVYRRGLNGIEGPADLPGLTLATLDTPGLTDALQRLQVRIPALSWQVAQQAEVADLLARVEAGSLDAALIYEYQFRTNRLFFTGVERGFALGQPVSLTWAVPSHQGLDLLDAANDYLDNMHQSGRLDTLAARYFGHDDYLEYVGTRTFLSHLNSRLPRYKALFQEAARNTGFDWKLLAALGYQESHWNPDAVSPTGVRGLMMLTRPTAQEMGIQDRTDPVQSIDGGSRYLRHMMERLPDSIHGEDRLYMAMAAYNVGLGHLYDARRLAEIRGEDKDSWDVIRTTLPLLQYQKWYSQTRHGYARGGEPVIYVRNIRRYRELLEHVERTREQFFQLDQGLLNQDGEIRFNQVPPVEQ